MDKKNLMPHQAQPITRITPGQLTSELTELSEETLNEVFSLDNSGVVSSRSNEDQFFGFCSYDGDDAE